MDYNAYGCGCDAEMDKEYRQQQMGRLDPGVAGALYNAGTGANTIAAPAFWLTMDFISIGMPMLQGASPLLATSLPSIKLGAELAGEPASRYGTAAAIPNLRGMSRSEVDSILRANNPTKVHVTQGGYSQYQFGDGSAVWIRPYGEVIRVPAPGTAPRGSRVGPDDDITPSHNTGERVRD